MVFFTTPELLEIGDIPHQFAREAHADEALEYYRRAASTTTCRLSVPLGEDINGEDGIFMWRLLIGGHIHDYCARKIVVSTGYYDLPNESAYPVRTFPSFPLLSRPHPYFDNDVIVWAARIPPPKPRSICGATTLG